MANVTPLLRTQKKDANGRCPVWLRISDRDGTRFLSLGVKVLPSQWNPRQRRVRKGHPNADLINRLISKKLDEAEAAILEAKLSDNYATAADVKGALTPSVAPDLFSFAERHLDALRRRGNVQRRRRLKAALNKLGDFAGRPLPMDRLTVALLRDWETHLVTELGNKQSTAAGNLSDVRALVKRAVSEGVIAHDDNPFLRFKIRQGEKAERTKLSFAEVEALEALGLEPGSLPWHARNYFLFAFYSGGVRFSDVATMKAGRVVTGTGGEPDRLAYRAGKTGKLQSVKVTPPARRILAHYLPPDGEVDGERYIFPMLDPEKYDLTTPEGLHRAKSSQNTLVNKRLKKLAEQAGIKKNVSFHIARHSFADAARSAGWSIYDISKALQHSSIEMTERYLRGFDSEALDERMDELFGGRHE